MTDEDLYTSIWETARRYVQDEETCDALVSDIWELLVADSKGQARQRSFDRVAGFMMGTMWGR